MHWGKNSLQMTKTVALCSSSEMLSFFSNKRWCWILPSPCFYEFALVSVNPVFENGILLQLRFSPTRRTLSSESSIQTLVSKCKKKLKTPNVKHMWHGRVSEAIQERLGGRYITSRKRDPTFSSNDLTGLPRVQLLNYSTAVLWT